MFDEGIDELLRLQDGGCHPDDACTTSPWPGSGFPFLAANVTRDDGTAPLAAGIIANTREPQFGPVDVDALAAWFRTQPPVTAPTEARITQIP